MQAHHPSASLAMPEQDALAASASISPGSHAAQPLTALPMSLAHFAEFGGVNAGAAAHDSPRTWPSAAHSSSGTALEKPMGCGTPGAASACRHLPSTLGRSGRVCRHLHSLHCRIRRPIVRLHGRRHLHNLGHPVRATHDGAQRRPTADGSGSR